MRFRGSFSLFIAMMVLSALAIAGCGHFSGLTPPVIGGTQSNTHSVHALDDGGGDSDDGGHNCIDGQVWNPQFQACDNVWGQATPVPSTPDPGFTPEDLCDEFPGSCDGPPPDGGGGATGGGGGGEPIATRTPMPGDNCWNSPAELGDNFPANTSGYATEISDILPIMANNGGGQPDVIGWIYITQDGDYVQENPAFTPFWSTMVNSIPIVGALGTAITSGGIVPIDSALNAQMQSYVDNHNGYIGACFNSILT